jgi:hypothetical protein
MNDVFFANNDVGLGVVVGLLSTIPVAGFIYVAESQRFSWFRLKLAGLLTIRRQATHASVTSPNSAAEASIG